VSSGGSGRGDLDVSVAAYGARPEDGSAGAVERCTQAFRSALADVAAAGGGTIRVPPGTFHLGPLNLTSNLVLWLESGATLRADVDQERLPLLPALPAYGPGGSLAAAKRRAWSRMHAMADLRDAIPRYQPLLYGEGLENVTITGQNGTLDGRGVVWWQRWLQEPLFGRPHLVEFERSRGILLRNVTLRNPGFWAVHFWLCEHVTVQFATILVTPWDPPVRPTNTDGINPDSSSHVLIEDSYLQTGDDAVAVKSGWDCFGRRKGMPSRNITIRRVVVRQTRGCNAAAVTIGSEMSGGVEGVLIEDCHFVYAGVGVEVKVGTTRGGFVRRVLTRNLTVGETSRGALVVMAVYPERNPFCTDPNPPAPVVSGISFEGVRVVGPTRGMLVQLQGTREVPLRNITVRDVRGPGPWACRLVTGSFAGSPPRACPALRAGWQQPGEPELPN